MEKRSISSYLKAWVRALSIEINYMKKHGGEKYTVGKGEYLGQQEMRIFTGLNAQPIYTFLMELKYALSTSIKKVKEK
jgi:hypothetical protein